MPGFVIRVRRHLRAFAVIWLLVQAAQVAALAPVDCCAAHRVSAAASEASCHEPAPPPHCPMATDERQCPMHAEHATHTARQDPSAECSLRGA
jgi:hypothetical protein